MNNINLKNKNQSMLFQLVLRNIGVTDAMFALLHVDDQPDESWLSDDSAKKIETCRTAMWNAIDAYKEALESIAKNIPGEIAARKKDLPARNRRKLFPDT